MNTKNTNQNKSVFLFLTAQCVSLLGSSIVQYAIIWYITLSTSSGVMLTISTICGFAPQLLVSLFGGTLLDRYDRKKIIMLTDGIIALSTLILAIVFLTGNKSIVLVFAVLAVRSAGTGIQTPAVQAVLPQITPPDKLMRINGIYTSIVSTLMFISPAISGAILGFANLEVTLFIDVFTAIIGICITSMVFIPRIAKKAEKTSAIQDIKEGFSYVNKNSFVKTMLIFQIVVLFLISPSAFLTPLMVSRSFGAEVWRLTAGEMCYGIGGILGGILISTWGSKAGGIISKNKMLTVVIAGFLYSLFMIGLGLFSVFTLYLITTVLIGIAAPCYNTPITTMIQERVEPEMQGRVFSLMQIAGSCALPLGMVLFGPIGDIVKIEHILVCCGIIVLAVSAVMFKVTKKFR